MTKLTHTSHLAGLLLVLIALSEASVTWRRVVKTTPGPVVLTTEQVPSTTKSSITWRRSTVRRRSTTTQQVPSTPPPLFEEEEEDEIEAAASKEEASHVEEGLDIEPQIKPLVPGSRPGFWIDSSRRKKQSSLLKSGSRRNSLFPTKPSTISAISSKAPSRFTPLTTASTTEAPKIKPSTTKSRFFGRYRLTKPPIHSRRTTKSTKTEPFETESEDSSSEKSDPEILESSVDDRERENIPSTPEEDSGTEHIQKTPPERSSLGLRRRLKNGTRSSWQTGAGRFSATKVTSPLAFSSTRTTSAPTTQDSVRISRRPTAISRLRNRVRANRTTSAPKVAWTRNQPSTVSPTKSTEKKRPEKVKGPPDYLRKRKTNKFRRIKITTTTPTYNDDDDEENVIFTTTTTPEIIEDYETSFTTLKPYEFKSRTTVEPFYLTRDYGQLITAVHDEKSTKSRTRSRNRTKTTEPPKLSTTESEIYSTTEEMNSTEEYNYSESTTPIVDVIDVNEDIVENVFSFDSFKTSTETPIATTKPTIFFEEETTEFAEYEVPTTPTPAERISSTSALATPPRPLFTADPGNNAYVVWSMGQNGSGWSYEKQGGQVKWSAINSPAAGDQWSVQGKDEVGQSLWTPTRNTSFLVGKQEERLGPKPSQSNKGHFNYETSSGKDNKRNSTLPAPFDVFAFQQSPPGIRDFTPPSYHFASNDYRTGVSNEPSTLQTVSLGPSDNETNFNDAFQFSNSSSTQEYITTAPESSGELSPTVLTPKDHYVQYFDGALTYPPAFHDEYTVQTPVLSLNNRDKKAQGDLSGIPAALVKAVVDAKRWTVVGNGGEEGWSLLGEDGRLEWKIRNVDGKWSVTSADEVMKMPIEVPAHSVSSGKGGVRQDIIGKEEKVTIPTVWRLEDDYEKWKALSAEGVTEVNSSKDNPNNPNGDYVYDQSEELRDDYYEGENDYENPAEGYDIYQAVDKQKDRPLWGENKMEINYKSHKNSKHRGNIQNANTKEDAIAAWKSLLPSQVDWIPSKKENTLTKIYQPTLTSYPHNIKSLERFDKKTASTLIHSGRGDGRNKGHIGATSGEYFRNPEINIYQHNQGKQMFEDPKRQDISNFKNVHEASVENRERYQDYSEQKQQINGNRSPVPDTVLELEEKQRKYEFKEAAKSFEPKDHAKVNALVSKLESIQKGGNGRTVVDLTHLVNLLKTKANSSATAKSKHDPAVMKQMQNGEVAMIRNKNEYDQSEVSTAFSQRHIPQEYQILNKNINFNQERNYKPSVGTGYSGQTDIKYQKNPSPERYQGYHYQPGYPETINDPFNTHSLTDDVTTGNRRNSENNSPLNERKYSDMNTRMSDRNIRPPTKHHTASKSLQPHGYADNEGRDIYFNDPIASEDPLNTRYNYQEPNKGNAPYHTQPDAINERSQNKQPDFHSPHKLHNANGFAEDNSRINDMRIEENVDYIRNGYKINSQSHPSFNSQVDLSTQRDPSGGKYDEEFIQNEDYRVRYQPRETNYKLKRNKHKENHKKPIPSNIDSHPLTERNDHRLKDHRETDLSTTYSIPSKPRNTRRRKVSGKRHRRPQNNQREEKISSIEQFDPNGQEGITPLNVDSSEELRYHSPKSHEHERRYEENNIHASRLKPLPVQYRRNEKRRSHKPYRPPPIVLSSETEIEESEDGTKKSRKIIVIDYAGKPKKKSSIDRKDLELIIRNVKNRRAEIFEDVSNNRTETNSTNV